MLLAYVVMITGLAISAVAIYYSVAGLVAIFAAAVVPIIIMGSVLEIGKLVTAVWLHKYWDRTVWWLKTYLTISVIVLMFITSMGIFGFLSKAHIEQTASSSSLVAQVERLDQEIAREQQTIERANLAIDSFGDRVADADTGIQARIQAQETIIANISGRLERDIAVQNQIISQSNGPLGPLQADLERIEERRSQLRAAQASNDIPTLQALVGTNADGVLGPDTRNRIAEFERELDSRRTEILTQLERLSNADDPAISAARAEITRLQQAANAEIARAQEAVNSFREQLVSVTTADNTDAITERGAEINSANQRIDETLTRKFELEAELRLLEVEVGPVKYLAEFIYGTDADKDLLEEAVRWVIITIIFVFDPLAVLLLLASQYTFKLHKEERAALQMENDDDKPPSGNDRSVDSSEDPLPPVRDRTEAIAREAEKYDTLPGAVDDGRDLVFQQQRQLEWDAAHSDESMLSAKQSWKADHPEETLKEYKEAYIQGRIDTLPWDNYITKNE
jgi:hypothetical protein